MYVKQHKDRIFFIVHNYAAYAKAWDSPTNVNLFNIGGWASVKL